MEETLAEAVQLIDATMRKMEEAIGSTDPYMPERLLATTASAVFDLLRMHLFVIQTLRTIYATSATA